MNLKKEGTYIILYQYLGYKTHKEVISPEKFAQSIDVTLLEEDIQLDEVKINPKENPAIAIIKNAIANRKDNSKNSKI